MTVDHSDWTDVHMALKSRLLDLADEGRITRREADAYARLLDVDAFRRVGDLHDPRKWSSCGLGRCGRFPGPCRFHASLHCLPCCMKDRRHTCGLCNATPAAVKVYMDGGRGHQDWWCVECAGTVGAECPTTCTTCRLLSGRSA
jgi:hypothetical protein